VKRPACGTAAWPPFKPVLEQYWQPYIRGRGTFDEAIAAVLAHLP
jgi:hypothetical protein